MYSQEENDDFCPEKRYEKELNEKQIELEFAQEQIRPHFFLNCISLIHGIADNKGETDIVTITAILSDR